MAEIIITPDITVESAARCLMAHARASFAPLMSQPVPGQDGLTRTVRVQIEVEAGIWSKALTHGGTAAWRDVLAERARQIEAKGYDAAHDDGHSRGEIALGAAAKAAFATAHLWPTQDYLALRMHARCLYPFQGHLSGNPDRRTELVQSAAMLIAEIERIDRAATAGNETC
ncbi:hypothetical protein ACT6QH_02130 [Xanthobacter sp. TB0139]|uniref:hypothetical protein n=1 Tax=Xanthobacter sp. TB0139 TaxID=3459178 RepID=UPI004039AA3F